jgi:cytochrome c556
MFRPMLVAAVFVAGVTAVAAQSNPIAARKDIMKAVGDQTKIATAMVREQAPFDLEKAHQIFAAYAEAAAKMPALFPPDSKNGDTKAAPRVWESMDDFKARFAKFEADAKAAGSAVKDLASFKEQFAAVAKSCGGCHESYRLK